MQTSVTFRHMDPSDALRGYAEQKSERLLKYLVEPVEVHWTLSVEKIRHIAEATIAAKDFSIKAQESTKEMYSSIDEVIDKLERQVRRHKEKVKSHKSSETEKYPYAASEAQKKTLRVVETENLFIKPMSIEEATMQMAIHGRDFMVFTDSGTNSVNVLYRRDDGDLGLIEARVK
ncbi:MAG: ribosome-associated translation inhibitor RaiA [Deltaproteobacteria bacterium]|nr:ribosome-associated translation inhibitor RaiA [Deltaproteobacteria bacterium]